MNGVAHATVGGIVGGLVGISVGIEPVSVEMVTLVSIGGIAGLIPDLDTNGMLSGKLTISHKLIKSLAILIGFLMTVYSFLERVGYEKWLGIGIGLGIMILASKFITQKRMLLMTSIGVVIGGLLLGTTWIWLMGVYIGVASFLPHRSYTHSLIGLAYFGYIAYLLSLDFNQIEGLFLVLVLGYISHLICDFKIFNKRGVKLFQPFLKMEI
ncbi:metal-dependent hydrolase [Virgibacillus sp. DJP39]|uniref:metal-dependent hydrolase n=1 Tax=Virgibacillus sp. DJP39 TaxID=3409790 RepID=UPI003BB52853